VRGYQKDSPRCGVFFPLKSKDFVLLLIGVLKEDIVLKKLGSYSV